VVRRHWIILAPVAFGALLCGLGIFPAGVVLKSFASPGSAPSARQNPDAREATFQRMCSEFH
jgi:hypothetical protein